MQNDFTVQVSSELMRRRHKKGFTYSIYFKYDDHDLLDKIEGMIKKGVIKTDKNQKYKYISQLMRSVLRNEFTKIIERNEEAEC